MKVGWTSNNHAGGWVRISLVPWSWMDTKDEATLKKNVMKVACYGHDTRPSKTRNGDCVHPCDGRGGCDYQGGRFHCEITSLYLYDSLSMYHVNEYIFEKLLRIVYR